MPKELEGLVLAGRKGVDDILLEETLLVKDRPGLSQTDV
jgi:hypothetical protein